MDDKKLFVVGAGFMGMGIVQTAASKGVKVSVYDTSAKQVDKGIKNIERSFSKAVAKGKYTEAEKQEFLSNITIAESLADCSDADFIVEAIVENQDIKTSVFKEIDKHCSDTAILASNTSSISITTLAGVIRHPEKFVGMHFFSPVPSIKLMEVVEGYQTSKNTIKDAIQFGEKLGKRCILSKDEPGFIINRMLIPMLNEACILLERKIGHIEEIDAGVKLGLNHPMGPLELVDMIGLDVELAVMEVLFEEIGDPKYRPAVSLRRMVDAGYLGKKSGIGFYVYNDDGTKYPNPQLS